MEEKIPSDAQERLSNLMADTIAGRISPAEASRATKAIFDEAQASAQVSKRPKTNPQGRKAGLIIRRGNKWLCRVYLGLDSQGKRQYQNHTVSGTKKNAQTWLTSTLRKKDLGQPTFESKVTLDKYLDEWLSNVAEPRVSEQTHRGYEWQLAHVKNELGRVQLSRLRPEDIQKLYGTLSSSTARHVHAPLRSALQQAVKWQLIFTNPCDAVELPRHRAREMQALTLEEAARLMAVERFTRKGEGMGKPEIVVENRYRALFAFLLATGARPSEALGLKWSDIEQATVTIQRTLQWHKGKGKGHYFAEPKTKSSRRSVPLPASLVRQLREHRAIQGEALLKLGVRTDLVFATTEGTPIMRGNLVKRHFKPALIAAKLPADFSLYGLRHTCASLLLQAGVHPKVVSERLGHSSTTLTMDVYSHIAPGMQEAATAQLETLLYG